MSNISILPDLLINKIAAGEVIERPAAVVRELLDNAIDGGATKIDVEVLHGGKKLVRVADNGTGMSRDDALLCLERHATSKIRSEDDLFDIATLGFRGEALPAIASVSKLTLETFDGNADSGVKIEIGVNQKKHITDAPPSRGTVIEIRDIFYNTPARRKFLKTNPTELSHIIDTVMHKAFAYPQIMFNLAHNRSELLNAPAAEDIKERFVQLYGDEMTAEFLDIQKESKTISVSGFTSSLDYTRASKSHQNIFVNKRPVKNATVNHAVYDVYRDEIARGRHPAYFLFIEIDPQIVDVNVHPAKREVKFEKPDEVHRTVRAAVYEALNPGHEVDLSMPLTARPFSYGANPGGASRKQDNPFVSDQLSNIFSNVSQTEIFSPGMSREISPFFHIGESFVANVSADGLVIIDQHAAHERILYEKFLKKTAIKSDPLVLPLRIELPVKEYNLIIGHKDFLSNLGLDIEDFGSNNVIVRAMPKELGKADMKGLLIDIAAGILDEETSGISGEITREALSKNIAARLACHTSVRGREHLNNEELSRMMTDLESADEPEKCPHGRPTRITLSLDELSRMFKRK
jgi:DNA mismatch repair protein MutL